MEAGKIYNLAEVAEYLAVSEQTVTRLVKSGKVKGFKVGTTWRFKGEEVLGYVDEAHRLA